MADEWKIHYKTQLPQIIDSLPRLLAAWVERQTLYTERLARQYAPVVSGNLVNSSQTSVWTTPTGAEGEVAFHAYYAAYVNFGSGRRGAASEVPARPPEVRYGSRPGTRARPYLSLAAAQAGEQLGQAARDLEDFLRAIR